MRQKRESMTSIRPRAALSAIGAFGAVLACASPLVPAIDRTFGSGSNSIVLAIDFNDGQSKDFVTWSYSFEEPPPGGTLHDFLLELGSLDTAFTYGFTDHGWGIMVDRFAVLDAPVSHDKDATNADLPRDWWSFWTADSQDTVWTSSFSGVKDVTVTNGSVYGFNYEPDWNLAGSPPNAIPEPGLAGLLLIGTGLLAWSRRRAS